MKSAQILREKIAGERLTLGVIITMHFWIDFIELARSAGLDYVIIDLEHLHHNEEAVATACAVGRMIDFPVLIRPPETTYSLVRLAADLGPCGLLLPQVRNAAMLDEVRDGLRMPPRGKRRPGGPGNRWVSDYQYTTWVEQHETPFIVLPQIESEEGLVNAEAIAGHEMTTAMAVGPYDLSANLGVCWRPDDPKLTAALGRIRAAGRAAGKNMWMIGDGPSLQRQGYTFLCIAEPMLLLEAALRQSVAALRSGAAVPVAGDKPLP